MVHPQNKTSLSLSLSYQAERFTFLDPEFRQNILILAKTLFLLFLGLLFFYLPMVAYAISGEKSDAFKIILAACTLSLATAIGTSLVRLPFPRWFGKWDDILDAIYFWCQVGIAVAVITYLIIIPLLQSIGWLPPGRIEQPIPWLHYRAPYLIIAATAVLCAFDGKASLRAFAALTRRRSNRTKLQFDEKAQAITILLFVSALQGCLVTSAYWLIHTMMQTFLRSGAQTSFLPSLLLTLTVISFGGVLVIFSIALYADSAIADKRAIALQNRNQTGEKRGDGPMFLKIVVFGGPGSGKSTLLAGAMREFQRHIPSSFVTVENAHWAETEFDQFKQDVEDPLYQHSEWPSPTKMLNALHFEVWLNEDGERIKVAKLEFLDYPGGYIQGEGPNQTQREEFDAFAHFSDGVLFIADGHKLKLHQPEKGLVTIRNDFIKLLRRLAEVNGNHRVVPICLTVTKADEFFEGTSPNVNRETVPREPINDGLQKLDIANLFEIWTKLCPSRVEYDKFATTAATFTEPGNRHEDAYILSGQPMPTPTGCAAPFYWTIAKVMRWNITLSSSIGMFIRGGNTNARAHLRTVCELERLADEWRLSLGEPIRRQDGFFN